MFTSSSPPHSSSPPQTLRQHGKSLSSAELRDVSAEDQAGVSFHVSLEASANAVDLHRDHQQVVVVGRNVFRIFSIDQCQFTERANLRRGKSLNLSFSSIDVAWNRLFDSQLATAAANGHVVLWDLHAPTRNKQTHVFGEHRRTCNRVVFHASEPHLLASCSNDGSLKLFDTRRQGSVLTVMCCADGVRDVQFGVSRSCSGASVAFHNQLVVATENGQLQMWDRARPDRALVQWPAHFGPVYSCRWHPTLPGCLASAGRDRTVKVWQIDSSGSVEASTTSPWTSSTTSSSSVSTSSQISTVLCRTVTTMAAVSDIAWRPNSRDQIATAALLLAVWHVQRPCVPLAVFGRQHAPATCVMWRGHSTGSSPSRQLLATGKDASLWLHQLRDAYLPTVGVANCSLALCGDSTIAAALSSPPTNRILTEIDEDTVGSTVTPAVCGGVSTAANWATHQQQQQTASAAFSSVPATASSTAVSSGPVQSTAVAVLATLRAQQCWLPLQRADDLPPALKHTGSSTADGESAVDAAALSPSLSVSPPSAYGDDDSGLDVSSSRLLATFLQNSCSRLLLTANCLASAVSGGGGSIRSNDWRVCVAACQYRMSGELAPACEWNESLAQRLGWSHVARYWRLLRLLFSDSESQSPATGKTATGEDVLVDDSLRSPTSAPVVPATICVDHSTSDDPADTESEDPGAGRAGGLPGQELTLASIASGLANAHDNFFFGDGEVNDPCLDYDDNDGVGDDVVVDDDDVDVEDDEDEVDGESKDVDEMDGFTVEREAELYLHHHLRLHRPRRRPRFPANNNSSRESARHRSLATSRSAALTVGTGERVALPCEAFELRHELSDEAPLQPTDAVSGALAPPPQPLTSPLTALQQLSRRLTALPAMAVPAWCPRRLLTQLITRLADSGDAQTAACLLLVLSANRPRTSPEPHQLPEAGQLWISGYLELLWKLQLWSVATRVIQLAPYESIRCLNQVGVHVQCGSCGRPAGHWCRRCRNVNGACAVCRRPVRGLMLWCQGCAHGGHLTHISEWFSRYRLCPTGCGHRCVPISV